MTETLRLFAALELPASILTQLAALTKALQAGAPQGSVRWVRPEGVHLTLKFYGEVEAKQVKDLQAVLTEAATTAGPLTFTLAGVGAFPNLTRPRVIWAGVAGDVAALKRLQTAVEAASVRLGFAPEAKPFNPHLTLGRVHRPLRPQEHGRLAQVLEQAQTPPGEPFTLDALSLMRSELRRGGALYTRLFSAPLTVRNI
ncbi:MAG: RNA 2',3'-cyclic phosphodiesterase [Anaerolineales bacterium]|nr:RNA 2',3'-cyclic phosphodiesterase [Anaerolineales bacterium]